MNDAGTFHFLTGFCFGDKRMRGYVRRVCLDSPLLFTSYPELSLVQMFDKLAASIDEMIQHTTVSWLMLSLGTASSPSL
jgi:hypothetical protein